MGVKGEPCGVWPVVGVRWMGAGGGEEQGLTIGACRQPKEFVFSTGPSIVCLVLWQNLHTRIGSEESGDTGDTGVSGWVWND